MYINLLNNFWKKKNRNLRNILKIFKKQNKHIKQLLITVFLKNKDIN